MFPVSEVALVAYMTMLGLHEVLAQLGLEEIVHGHYWRCRWECALSSHREPHLWHATNHPSIHLVVLLQNTVTTLTH